MVSVRQIKAARAFWLGRNRISRQQSQCVGADYCSSGSSRRPARRTRGNRPKDTKSCAGSSVASNSSDENGGGSGVRLAQSDKQRNSGIHCRSENVVVAKRSKHEHWIRGDGRSWPRVQHSCSAARRAMVSTAASSAFLRTGASGTRWFKHESLTPTRAHPRTLVGRFPGAIKVGPARAACAPRNPQPQR